MTTIFTTYERILDNTYEIVEQHKTYFTQQIRFLHALLVPAEAEGHQRPAVWKVRLTASAV